MKQQDNHLKHATPQTNPTPTHPTTLQNKKFLESGGVGVVDGGVVEGARIWEREYD